VGSPAQLFTLFVFYYCPERNLLSIQSSVNVLEWRNRRSCRIRKQAKFPDSFMNTTCDGYFSLGNLGRLQWPKMLRKPHRRGRWWDAIKGSGWSGSTGYIGEEPVGLAFSTPHPLFTIEGSAQLASRICSFGFISDRYNWWHVFVVAINDYSCRESYRRDDLANRDVTHVRVTFTSVTYGRFLAFGRKRDQNHALPRNGELRSCFFLFNDQ
jgi:hypothetical protein